MKKFYFLFLYFSILVLDSCKKDQSISPNPKVDIYITGRVNGQAVYWRNDSLMHLNLTDGTRFSSVANSIIVSGTDVYVAGSEGGKATIWKNGEQDLLRSDQGLKPGQVSAATSIAILGDDVYMGGYEANPTIGRPGRIVIGRIWKNGILMDPEIYTPFTSIHSLFVSGNDLYVAGSTYSVAKYWKNGIEQELVDGSTSTSIVVSGNDVFIAGEQWDENRQLPDVNGIEPVSAKYWKNGTPVNLTDGSTGAGTTSIAVSGSDVYVAGVEFNGLVIDETANGIAKYWKNASPVNLTDGSTDAIANAIAVSGTDVYVAGTESDGTHSTAKYWKNGSLKNLTDGTTDAAATAIFISKQ